MSEFLLTQVINYGAPLLGLIVFIGGLGVPLPCTLLVIAAGAFARQGILPWHTTVIISIISVVIGDSISYSLGYYSRELILQRFQRHFTLAASRAVLSKMGSVIHFLFALFGDCHCITRQPAIRDNSLSLQKIPYL